MTLLGSGRAAFWKQHERWMRIRREVASAEASTGGGGGGGGGGGRVGPQGGGDPRRRDLLTAYAEHVAAGKRQQQHDGGTIKQGGLQLGGQQLGLGRSASMQLPPRPRFEPGARPRGPPLGR